MQGTPSNPGGNSWSLKGATSDYTTSSIQKEATQNTMETKLTTEQTGRLSRFKSSLEQIVGDKFKVIVEPAKKGTKHGMKFDQPITATLVQIQGKTEMINGRQVGPGHSNNLQLIQDDFLIDNHKLLHSYQL